MSEFLGRRRAQNRSLHEVNEHFEGKRNAEIRPNNRSR